MIAHFSSVVAPWERWDRDLVRVIGGLQQRQSIEREFRRYKF
jgi:hypothetical protein